MNSPLSGLELMVAVICLFSSILNWFTPRKETGQCSPTGGSTTLFLVSLMVGLAAFVNDWGHGILLLGSIALLMFGFTAFFTASIAWFERHARAVLALIGALIASVTVAIVYNIGDHLTEPTTMAIIFIAGVGCLLIWNAAFPKPANNDVTAIEAPPPITKV